MPSVDFARWTTTLTASYLAITAASIAILGTAVPGRVGLVAVHLTLSGAWLILNCVRPSAGILRVIHDWHPLLLFPFLYKEVELLAPALGAVDCGDSGLGVGVVLRAAEPVSQRTAGVRAAVRGPAFLLPVLCHRHSIGGRGTGTSAGGWRPSASCCCCSRRCCWGATCSSSCCRWTARTTCRRAWDRRSRPLLLRSRSSDVCARRRARRCISQRARVRCGRREPGGVAAPAPARVPARSIHRESDDCYRVRAVPLRPRHACRRGPRDRRRGGVSISLRQRARPARALSGSSPPRRPKAA